MRMWGLVALAVVTITSTARADDRDIGLVVQGHARLRARLETHLTKQLQREGFIAVDAPISRAGLDTLANCFIIEDLVCARGVVEARAKTARLIYARIDDADGALTIDITWFSNGHPPSSERVACEDCADTWKSEVDGALRKLASTAPVPLQAAPDPGVGPEGHGSRLLPGTLIATGIATFLAGGVLLYYGLRDGESHKYVYPQLTPIGISLLAVGGGAAIGGVFLLKPSGSPRSGPIALASRRGAYVGWAYEF